MSLLTRLESRLPKNAFWRNLTIVAGGTAAGQALSILASPILSRLYDPGDLGLLSVYASVTSIVAVVSSLSYNQAIPAPDDQADGVNLTILSLLLVAGSSALTAVAVLLARFSLERYLGIPGFARYAVVVPLGVFGLSAYEGLSQWCARQKAFGLIAKTSAQRSVVQVVAQLAGGFAKLGTGSLVVGQLLGQWAGTFRLARESWTDARAELHDVSLGSLKDTARRFRRFPMFTLPGAILNALDANAAPLLFAHFFGAAVTGYFSLGHRLIAVPFTLVGSSAQKVFYPAAAAARQRGTLAKETEDTFRRLLRLVLPIVLIMTACAPELFAVVMGAKWREAGVYMQWLSPRACFTMLVFPLTPLIFVLDKQLAGTLFSCIQLVLRVGGVWLGSRYGNARMAVALLGVLNGLLWLAFLIYLLSITGNSIKKAMQSLLLETLIAAGIACPIFAAKLVHATDLEVTLAAGVASVLAVVIVVRRTRARGARIEPIS